VTAANKTKSVSSETAAVAVKVLLYDIECTPMIGWTYGPRWEAHMIEIIEEKRIISFAWKWLGETQVRVLALPDFPGYKRNPKSSKALLRELHKLIGQADVVIGHNVDCFDDKMANTELIVNDFTPPPPHKTVDTLKVARSKFAFSSNKLEDLGIRLGVGRKVKHPGWPMWKGCIEGDPKSWAQMRLYNLGDVVLLEAVYRKMRPWMTSHPCMNATDNADRSKCPHCGAPAIQQSRRGWFFTVMGKVMRFQCKACGRWTKGKFVKRMSSWTFKQ
jgi:hypothetical protein